jgi:hypothetical protein
MSCSGGEAGLMADAAVGHGRHVSALGEAQTKPLREALGGHVALANPLDYHTFVWGDRAAIARTFTAMMQGDLSMAWWWRISPAPIAATLGLGSGDRGRVRHEGRDRSTHGDPRDAARDDAGGRGADAGPAGSCRSAGWMTGSGRSRRPHGWGRVRAPDRPLLPVAWRPAGPAPLLSEAEAKACLRPSEWTSRAARPWPGPRRRRMRRRGSGFPVVLKASGLAHKTEAGGVALNLGAG